VKVRAVTVGLGLSWPLPSEAIERACDVCLLVKRRVEARGIEVQTTRLCGGSIDKMLDPQHAQELPEVARRLAESVRAEGVDYCSLGVVQADARTGLVEPYVDGLTDALGLGLGVFGSVQAATTRWGVNPRALRRSAALVKRLATVAPDGSANRHFCVSANVPPNGAFFPSAYHRGPRPHLAFALEAADVAVRAFQDTPSAETGAASLTKALTREARPLERIGLASCEMAGMAYSGIDVSLAPFPSDDISIGAAIEALGGGVLGSPGALAAVAAITGALRRVKLRTCGFSGVMLPVLEDSVLTRRNTEGRLDLDKLLLYSAVCGTGLDTIPLPGDVTEEQLTAILLDVCTLAVRLDKPLTARLMPIPGKRAGDLASFEFPFFAANRVMAVPDRPLSRLLA